MAISGLHVGLIFVLFSWLVGFLLSKACPQIFLLSPKQKIVLIPALLMAILYAALSGFAISTIRAIFMLALYVVLRFLGLRCSLLRLFVVCMVLVLFMDVFAVLDAGFWFSCCAVFIIAINVEQKKKITDIWRLQYYLWLGKLPISALFFPTVALLSPFINIIAVPLFSLVIIPLSFMASVWLLIDPHVYSQGLIHLLAQGIEWVNSSVMYLSGFSWVSVGMTFFQAIFLLIGIVGVVHYRRLRYIGVLSLSLFTYSIISNHSKSVEMVFFDVAQGVSVLIITDNRVFLYDTGARYRSGFSAMQAVVLPYLQKRNINFIDTVIISHADNDHIGGLSVLQRKVKIGRILMNETGEERNSEPCEDSQKWYTSSAIFTVISPSENTPEGKNNRSCVLRISAFGKTVLLTGDIEKETEQYLLKKKSALMANILLVPHHGSQTSSTLSFINAVNPQWAIVSAGYLNRYHHPHMKVIKRYQNNGVKLLSTATSGSVRVFINKKGISLEEYRAVKKRFWRR